MTKLGLTLNETKTSLKDARTERFNFLGYAFGPHCYKRNGNRYLGASPSKKSVKRVKTKISNVLGARQREAMAGSARPAEQLYLRGWSNYFCHGTRGQAYQAVDHHVYERVRDFLARRHKVAKRGTRTILPAICLTENSAFCRWITAVCLAMKPVGEKLWGGRRRSWHLHRPYELMEVTPWPKSMISAEA